MARVVYVILAHNEPINLVGLVASLWNSHDAFEIWIDPDCSRNLEPYISLLLDYGSNVRVHTGRSMCWGGYSLVQMTFDSYAALEELGSDYSHAILMSGTHVPLIGADEIFENIRQLPGWLDIATVGIPDGNLTFVDTIEPGWSKDILQRLRYRYQEVPSIGMFPIEKRDRWPKDFIHKGSQWHVLRRDQVQFLLEREQVISRLLADVNVADEFFIQNALCDSPCFSGIRKSSPVFTEWDGVSPRRISFSELSSIARSGQYLFARKVDSKATIDDWVQLMRSALQNEAGIERLKSLEEKTKRYKLHRESSDAALPELRRLQVESIMATLLDHPAQYLAKRCFPGKGGSSAWMVEEPVAEVGGSLIFLLLLFQWGRGCTFVLLWPNSSAEPDNPELTVLPMPYGPFDGFSLLSPSALRSGTWWTVSTQEAIEGLVDAIHEQISRLKFVARSQA